MIIALDAAANVISDSDICPTALCNTLICISGVDSLISESLKASTDPSTSPFTTKFNSWKLPTAIRRPISSRVNNLWVRKPNSRCNCSRLLAISRASCSVSITWNTSPAWGAPFKPRIWTGADGPATSIRAFLSLNIAFTFPWLVPANTTSPLCKVPFCTNTVATYPRPLSKVDSIIEPVALRLGFAFKSSNSASNKTFSISSCTPVPFLAEISCDWYLPPQSSTR